MLTIDRIKIYDKSNMYHEIKNMYKQIELSFKIINDLDKCTLLQKISLFNNAI